VLDIPDREKVQTSPLNITDYSASKSPSVFALEKSEFTARIAFFTLSTIAVITIALLSQFWRPVTWGFVVVLPLIMLGAYDIIQKKRTVLRLYPVIGHMRYLLESIRPEIQQYFVESDTNGAPISREYRSLVYQRAKNMRDTRPFGTLFDVYRTGYEWVNHSIAPATVTHHTPKIRFGGKACSQPYEASLLNISAMSYGALSKNAILALNKGAKIGKFAHNTGEGGISPYHLKHGGDLIWQIGTGYFGCRDINGNFDPALFAEKSSIGAVKMIEIKLSQGAKPGHGGILPAVKLTPEIAAIRHVPMGKDVISPAAHSAFSTPTELLIFVAQLRDLSKGKPVGIKLCIGKKSEFLGLCKAMLETGITPDFITIDGAEGGTGAAPIEMTNSVGTPLREGLAFVQNALIGIGLREQTRLIASGKVISAFHMLRLMALGADTINSARAMMLALGCIQARHCHNDNCPTGIATQKASRFNALDVDSKAERVANFQAGNIQNLLEIMAGAGLEKTSDIALEHVNHRVDGSTVQTYEDLYERLDEGSLLDAAIIPPSWQGDWNKASATSW